jgi:hypothetical protein
MKKIKILNHKRGDDFIIPDKSEISLLDGASLKIDHL